ncbi:uncharacterized protein LY89DRAFT_273733 [Mollisia scopiformis]|uniref:Uncharacterized protein n=1 Tax=Mollisia scopiformis TaxID=149040 RepID=A0A132BB35_MOLSC|nr:uncharacterized protein LY89DRAFT_273733 [Mollisia scopiformis]KUJ09588.1 hypothetical protein LY89DRAFT_273733 [Mollisia scopiformis]
MDNTSALAEGQPSSLYFVQSQIFNNSRNTTALKTIIAPSFVASPELRGTLTILWSCIITLIACIYTALHLNVPGETGKFKALATKGKWVLIGLIAPEVVLYLACSQFLEARRLANELNRIALERGEEKLANNSAFDIKYGFFVVMGGLEISAKDIVRSTWRDSPRGTLGSGSLRLTPNGVLQLASLGYFVPVPRSKIDDKSKADVVQKCLVMMQVVWMATQCIVRKVYGLPLSLLEVHTMVHVFCALLMYLFWMEKPLDMHDPEVVNSEEYEDIVALMIQEQFHDKESDEIIIYPKSHNVRTRPPAIKWIHSSNAEKLYVTAENGKVKAVKYVPMEIDQKQPTMLLNVGEALDCGVSLVSRMSSFEREEFRERVVRQGYEYLSTDDRERWELKIWYSEPTLPSCELQRPDITRLERVVAAIERIDGPVHKAELLHPEHREPRFAKEHYHESFSRSAGNIQYTGESQMDPEDIVMFIFNSKVLLVLLLALPAVYGGIHFIVSNFDFPSPLERFLWRIAAIDIVATMPVFFALTWIGHFLSGCFGEDDEGDCLCSVSYKFPGHVLLFGYILCRLYIVIESFVSLRYLPIGVFWTPSWIQMIPHI